MLLDVLAKQNPIPVSIPQFLGIHDTFTLFFERSSGFMKIGRSSNFDKRLSEIRRGTTDEHVEVLGVFYSDAETIAERERELKSHLNLLRLAAANRTNISY